VLYERTRSIFRSDTPEWIKERSSFADLLSGVLVELENKRLGESNNLEKTQKLTQFLNDQLERIKQGTSLLALSSCHSIYNALIEISPDGRRIDKEKTTFNFTSFRDTLKDTPSLSTERLIELRDYCKKVFDKI